MSAQVAYGFAHARSAGPHALFDAPVVDWSQHEHMADSVTKEAQRLVNLAGSVALALQAVEAAAEPAPAAVKDSFARELGFGGVAELRAATAVVEGHDGADWNLTRDSAGDWIAWNEQRVEICGRFPSRESGMAALRGGAEADGWRL